MNKQTKATLSKLEALCVVALREQRRQSMYIGRGDMRAIVAAVHDLQKAGKFPKNAPASPTEDQP